MTKLQERIMRLIKNGKSTSQIMSETKASATYVRRFLKRSVRAQAPVRVRTAGSVRGVTGAIGIRGVMGITNGHLSIKVIEARVNAHLAKAAELRRAADALRGEGLLS